jgi:addiction module RelB/DinJ family antitoxin
MAKSTNTATILNIKTDKKLKAEAKVVAEGMGLTLTTVVNSMLKQFVLEREITFSAKVYEPSPYLIKALEAAEAEYKSGKVKRYSSVEAMRSDLVKK